MRCGPRSLISKYGASSWRSEASYWNGEILGVLLDEEVEGIDDRHLGDEPHMQPQLHDRLREDRPPDHISERILLSIQAMIGRLDVQPVVADRRSRMGRREKAYHVRGEPNRTVVLVVRRVVERDVNGHRAVSIRWRAAVCTNCDRAGAPNARCGRKVSAPSQFG
jgi:hypothetical protein